MSADSKPPRIRFTTTRRRFVGGVGTMALGCASDDSGALQQADEMQPPSASNPPPSGSPPASVSNDPEAPPAATGTAPVPEEAPTMLGNGGQSSGDLGGNGDPGEDSTPEANGPAAPEPGTCTLYPEQTEGPYYVDGDLVRSDIREGKPGAPLTLDLLVVSAGACAPLANVAVDIWHCDAAGVYSGYQGQLGGLDTRGEVFLRGTQVSGSDGRVRFQTIYPGWYPGRTTHVHFKVHLPGNREATSQLYFEEALNTEVYASDPYAAHGQKDTSNAADGFAGNAPITPVVRNAQGYAGSLILTVAG